MVIDIPTLLLIGISASLVFFLTFATSALNRETHPGFIPWTFGILLQALAFLSFFLWSAISDFFVTVGTPCLLVLSALYKLNGLRQFLHVPPLPRVSTLLVLGIAIQAGFFSYISPHIGMNNLLTTLCLASLMLAMTRELARQLSGKTQLHLLGSGFLLVNSVSLIIRAYEWLMHPDATVTDGGIHDAVYLHIAILSDIGINSFFLLLHAQRTNELLHGMNVALIDSENRYRNLARATSETILLTRHGRIVEANANACSLFGLGLLDLKGRHITDIALPKYHQQIEAVIRSGKDQCYEVTLLHKDGLSFPAEIHSRPITWQGEESRICVIRDLTARKQSEKLLQERDKLYVTLFEMNRSAMLLIDPDTGRIIDANRAARAFYGYTNEEFSNLKISDINTLSEQEVHAEMVLAAEEQRQYFNFNHKTACGDIHQVEVITGPITYKNKRLLCSVVHDITARKQAEQEREELIASLQKALKEIKTLRGILPICSHCRNIRNDQGSWSKLEHYVREHSEATFSHGICPDCVKTMYPELADEILGNHGSN